MKKLLALLLTATLLVATFAACGTTDTPSDTPTAPADDVTSDDVTTTDDAGGDDDDDVDPPLVGAPQILRFGTTGIDGKFLSVLQNNLYDSYVSMLVFEGLVSNDIQGLPIPGPIAEGWELSDDHLSYTFTLKDGVYFSDGVPMTAADVEFTYRTMAHPDYDGPRSYAVDSMLGYTEFRAGETDEFPGVEVIDDKTIVFHFEDARPTNIWDCGYGIMPMHIYAFDNYEELLDQVSNPIGSGKFIFEEYAPMEIVRLGTNRGYWGPDTPTIDGIFMLEVPGESLQAAFQNGDIDVANPETNIDNDEVFNAMAGIEVQKFLGNGYQYLAFNTTRPQLSDARVRQALMYGLDRQAYIDINFGSLGSVGMTPISPASWAFPDSSTLNDYALDLDKAAALFAEAGWEKGADGILEKDGERMELSWLVYTDTAWPGILSGLAYDSWAQLGVDLNIELLDFASVISHTMDPEPGEKDFDIYTMGFSLSIDPDPSGALFDYDAYNAGGFNASGYYNEHSQELIYAGRTEFDQDVRTDIYHEWGELMNEELPSVIIAYRHELWAVADRVQGLNIDTYWEWYRDLSNVTLN